jgi:DNA polymerase III alpha subunit
MCETPPRKQDFVHLHAHTSYSIQDALATPPEYAAAASRMGFRAAAITDHGRLGGVPEFVESCRLGGVKPIVGCELYVCEDRFQRGAVTDDEGAAPEQQGEGRPKKKLNYHLTVLAKNDQGYRNLLALADIGAREGYYYRPRVDFDALTKHREGLILMTGCLGSEVNQAILRGEMDEAHKVMGRYREVWGEDYLLEMHHHGIPAQKTVLKALMELNQHYGLTPVAANDVHYMEKLDWEAHQLQKNMSNISSGKLYDYEAAYGSKQFWLKSDQEMLERFAHHPEMVTNTLGVAERVEDFLRLDTRHLLPHANIPQTPEFLAWKAKALPYHPMNDAYLAYIAFEGLKARGLAHLPDYKARLKRECENVWAMGVTDYFLIQREVVEYMNSEKIMFGVRGSGVGSLLNWCLEISTIDPLKWDLMFERFLNPGRGTQYDVDFTAYKSKDYLKAVGTKNQTSAITELRTLWNDAKIQDPTLARHEPDVARELWVLENQLLGTYLFDLKEKEITSAVNEPQLWSAWLLGLTPQQPEAPMRVKKVAALPDIDTDIDSRYRDKVILWCKQRFGQENVAPICNYGTYKARAAVKGALKTSTEFKERFPNDYLAKLEEIAKTIPEKMREEEEIPDDEDDEEKDQIQDAILQSPDFAQWARRFPREIELARKMLGRISNQGVHASGVLIASEPIAQHAPIEKAKKKANDNTGEEAKDEFVAAYDMKRVERVGLVKWDFLGLSMWTKISVCLDLIKANRGIVIDFDKANPNDQKIFELYRSGKTSTLFQAGGRGMKGALREVGVTCVEDLIAIFALYRPGPMAFISEYAEGKKNPSSVKYSDPKLKEILGKSFGIPVFQEQAMKMAREMADFNWLETQDMQKAVSKKDPEKFKKCFSLFADKARGEGVSEQSIAELDHRLVRFSGYAFNRAHSASYADLSFKGGYLRTYYPLEWMAACLFVDRGKKDTRTKQPKISPYLEECHADGIGIVNPDVNISGMEVRIEKGKIIQPLVACTGVGSLAAPIAEAQPYTSFRDLVMRVKPNKSVIKALHAAQALRSLKDASGKGENELLELFDAHIKELKVVERERKREENKRFQVDSPLAREAKLRQEKNMPPRDAPKARRDEETQREIRGPINTDMDIEDMF